MRPRRRTNRTLVYYLLLNILVSAATTLAVLFAWEFFTSRELAQGPAVLPPGSVEPTQPVAGVSATLSGETPPSLTNTAPAAGAPEAAGSETGGGAAELPPLDTVVIEIQRVAGVGDIDQEVLTLRRVGDGDLVMAGWKLYDEGGNTYIFPDSPSLVLFKDGGVQIYSKGGADTATEIYWNRGETVYEPTELIQLEDPQGNVRATYRVP